MTRRKVPETCAVCDDANRFFESRVWTCWNDDTMNEWGAKRIIPCARGRLPKPPKWCPLRKAGA